jgi:transmembrane sensor
MEERIHYLFKQYLDNSCSRKELEEFFGYVHRAEHDELLRQLIKKVFNDLKVNGSDTTYVDVYGRLVLHAPEWLEHKDDPQQNQDMQPVITEKPTIPLKSSNSYVKYLVAVLVIIVAGTTWIIRESDRNKQHDTAAVASLTKKVTDRSDSKFLLLKDSTQVWLNAASSLEFPDQFDQKKREVYLSGEAFFDVKHADKIPFIIHTGSVSTSVLGTAFNIKAYPGQKNIIISVSRGKVKIIRKDGWEVTLTEGQQLRLNENGQEASEKNIPTESIAGWQQGNISYDDEPLKDIISDMERIYNVNISLDNLSLSELQISTSFKREIGVEQALQVLCKLTDTELTKTGNNYSIQ